MDLQINCPAKVNLFLYVQPPVEGFHPICSFMHTIGWYDSLHIRRAERFSFHVSGMAVPAGSDNLVVRAVACFARHFLDGRLPRLRVSLHKRIPHAAGLGGGSADAAMMARFLAAWHGCSLHREFMQDFVRSCGCDTAFFFSSGSALVSGRGEDVRPLPFSLSLPVLVIKPTQGLATSGVYHKWDEDNPLPAARSNRPCSLPPALGRDVSAAELGAVMHNDLQQAAFSLCPDLARIATAVPEPFSRRLMLSGSGSALYVVLEPDERAAVPSIIAHLPGGLVEKSILTKFIAIGTDQFTSFLQRGKQTT